MTRRIIPLPRDSHRDLNALLPCYVAGRLDETEDAEVRAHLSHCADCRAEMLDEPALMQEIVDLPIGADAWGVEHGWASISWSLAREAPRRAPWAARIRRRLTQGAPARLPARSDLPWLRWALAFQVCLLLGVGVAVWRFEQQAPYHALGAVPANAAANIVVVFRPETPERNLRAFLRLHHARLVGGPTEADAYLLHVPAAGRNAALSRMRRQAQVVRAEAVDAR